MPPVKVNSKTRLLWELSPQKKELELLKAKLKQNSLSSKEWQRWSYLEAIQREIDKYVNRGK